MKKRQPALDIANPVSRLVGILDAATAVSPESKNPDFEVEDIWAKILGVGQRAGDGRSQFYKRYGMLHDLFDAAELSIKNDVDPRKIDAYTGALNRLRDAINPRLVTSKWSNVKNHLDPHALALLRICAIDLTKPENDNSSTLQSMQEEVQLLKGTVLDSDIDESLKRFIVEQLSKIDLAITECRLRGTDALTDVMESVVGALVIHRNELRDEWEAHENSESVKGFSAILRKLELLLVEVHERYPRLTQTARDLMPLLPAAMEKIKNSAT